MGPSFTKQLTHRAVVSANRMSNFHFETLRILFLKSNLHPLCCVSYFIKQLPQSGFVQFHTCSQYRYFFKICSNRLTCRTFEVRCCGRRKSVSTSSFTLIPPITTKVPYVNSLDPDETPNNSASHPDPSCLTPRQHIRQL